MFVINDCVFLHLNNPMKISELKKKLKTNGCYFVCDGKNHEWWWSPVTEQRFQLPRHSTADVGKELMKYVREQSGINVK